MNFSEIGNLLQKNREMKSLSLEQIHEITKIPTNYLIAIENGNHDVMPEPVYVNGYIKSFAEAVNVDSESLAQDYKAWINQNPDANQYKNLTFTNNVNHNHIYKIKNENPSQNLFKLVYYPLFLIPLMLMLVVFLYTKQSENIDSPNTGATISIPKNIPDSTNKDNSQSNSKNDLFANSSDSSEKPVSKELVLIAKKRVWVEVRNLKDDSVVYSGVLDVDSKKTFENNSGLKIHVANGTYVDIDYQNKIEQFSNEQKPSQRIFNYDQAIVLNNNDSSINSSNSNDPKNNQTTKTSTSLSTTDSAVKPNSNTKPSTSKPKTKKTSSQQNNSSKKDLNHLLEVPYRYNDE